QKTHSEIIATTQQAVGNYIALTCHLRFRDDRVLLGFWGVARCEPGCTAAPRCIFVHKLMPPCPPPNLKLVTPYFLRARLMCPAARMSSSGYCRNKTANSGIK